MQDGQQGLIMLGSKPCIIQYTEAAMASLSIKI